MRVNFTLPRILTALLATAVAAFTASTAEITPPPSPAPARSPADASQPHRHDGVIDGAHWVALEPRGGIRRIWIEAHGLRPPSAPLVADLDARNPLVAELLADGWLVATTSYRRNGRIVADAVADILALQDQLHRRFGTRAPTYLEGSSMGGAIGVHLAEQHPARFRGILAIGAALDVPDPAAPGLAFNHRPGTALLFLSNRTETAGPSAYARTVASLPGIAPGAIPAVWRVEREGHVNVSTAERLSALSALLGWAEEGIWPADGDGTLPAPQPASRATFSPDGRTATARVTEVSRVYGNLVTDLVPADLQQLGVSKGGSFDLATPGGSFRVLWGSAYGDVAQGAWIAFTTADGVLMVARNFANAAESARLLPGETFTVTR